MRIRHQLLLLLFVFLLPSLRVEAQEHLTISDIQLGQPFDRIVSQLRAHGFKKKSDVDDASLLIGKFWGHTPTAAIPLRTSGDTCHMLMMIVPDPGSASALFSTYNNVRAQVTEKYGIYGKEQNFYLDEQLNDFSSIDDRINAVRYDMATLYTEFITPVGQIGVSINTHPATGLGVFVIFTDCDYVDPDQQQEEVITVEENQALEPTRVKGVDIDRPMPAVVAELKGKGLSESTSFIERYLLQKSNVTRLHGEYFGYPDCEFILSGQPNVQVVNIRFPASSTWADLYSLYTRVRLELVKKYGSIYINEDQVAGVTEHLEQIDSQRALSAIRNGQAHLQTLLLNRFDDYTFKVAISYYPADGTYHVALIYYTPQGFVHSLKPTDNL